MGRKRQKQDQWMPSRVYRGHSAYELRTPGKTIRLCDLTATKAEVWRAFEDLVITSQADLNGLIDLYFKSDKFLSKSDHTQKAYKRYSIPIIKTFGKMPPDNVKSPHIRVFMDKVGKRSEVLANRYLAFIGAVYSWGYQRGKTTIKPHIGVDKFKEIPRSRYVTDEEYKAVYDKADLVVKVAMEVAYCCAARVSDVLKVKKNDITNEGIYIKQGKTGKEQIKEWNLQLRKAVKLTKDLPMYKKYKDIGSIYLIHNMKGQKYTYDGFDTYWQKAKKGYNFTFHDLKAKSVSDHDGDKRELSGHKSEKMIEIYNRKITPTTSLKRDKKSSE